MHYGLGKHVSSLSPEHIHQAVKWDYVQSVPLVLAAMWTKISIFFFLRRMFLTTRTKWTWTWTLHFINGVNIAANVASATTQLTQCTPASKLWDPTVPGTCWAPGTQAAVGIFQGGISPARWKLYMRAVPPNSRVQRHPSFAILPSQHSRLSSCGTSTSN